MKIQTMAILIAVVLWTTTAVAQTETGAEALDFALESLGGDTVSLSDFRGQVVLLNFFGYS